MDNNLTLKYLQSSPGSDSRIETPISSNLNFAPAEGRISEEQLLQPSSSSKSMPSSNNVPASQEKCAEAPSEKALTSISSGMVPPASELFRTGAPDISSGVQNPCHIGTGMGECSGLIQPVIDPSPKKLKKKNRCGSVRRKRKKAALLLQLVMSEPSIPNESPTINITSSHEKDACKNPTETNNISNSTSCSWVRQVLSYSRSSSSEDEVTSKRPNSDGSSLEKYQQMSKRPRDESLGEASKNLAQISNDNLLQRMIVRLDQKSVSFSIDEALEFSDAVGDLVEKLPSGTPIPHLVARCVGHQLIVTADDHASLQWLLGSIDKIQPWKGIALIAKEVQPVRLRYTSIWIPGKRHQSTNDTLTSLERYNPGLSTKFWEVVERHEEDRGLNLFVKIDQASLKFLKDLGFRLHIKAAVAQITTLDS